MNAFAKWAKGRPGMTPNTIGYIVAEGAWNAGEAAANERIRVLEAKLVVQTDIAIKATNTSLENFLKWGASEKLHVAERVVSAKLMEALEFYANGRHSISLYGPLNWPDVRKKLEDNDFTAVGEDNDGTENYVEGGRVAAAALDAVEAIRAKGEQE